MTITEAYNSIAHKWSEEHWNHRVGWCDDLLHMLKNHIGVGGKVLDIGCGSGEDCKFLADLGLRPVGIDITDGFLKEAQSRFPQGKFIAMDVRELDFPQASFDGVIAKHSLLHISKKEFPLVLEKINTVLRPGGWFVLTLTEGIGEKDVTNIRLGERITRFFAYYTSFEVGRLLQDAGFKVEEESLSKGAEHNSLKFLAQKV